LRQGLAGRRIHQGGVNAAFGLHGPENRHRHQHPSLPGHPTRVPVHGPIHASRPNQIEIHFSIIQRKVLTPNAPPYPQAVAERLANFECHFESMAHPFE
jgi:hypothetical protein